MNYNVFYPLFLLIILVHSVVYRITRRRFVNLLFAMILIFISVVQFIIVCLNQYVYVVFFSTIGIFGNFSQPVVFVYDPLVSLVLLFISIIYFIYCWRNHINIYIQLLFLLIILLTSVIDVLSLPVLLIFTVVTLYVSGLHRIDEKTYMVVLSLIYIFAVFAIISLKHFNLGYLIMLYDSNILPSNQLFIGYLYITVYLIGLLAMYIDLFPFIKLSYLREQVSVDNIINLLIVNSIIIIIVRLVYSFGIDLIREFIGTLLYVLGIINLYYWSINYVRVNNPNFAYIIAYSLLLQSFISSRTDSLIPLILYLSLLYVHIVLEKIGFQKDILSLSLIGVFPYPGFIPLIYLLSILYSFNIISFIMILLPILIVQAILLYSNSYFQLLCRRDSLILVLISILILILYYFVVHDMIPDIASKNRYKAVVFGW